MRLTETYGTHNYHPLPVNLVRAEGVWVYDDRGRAYLDCIGSYSALAHGHLSPFLIQTMQAQLESLTLTSRAVYNPYLALFLEGLCRYTGFDMACPMNTGAEAVETALKLARKWAYTRKGVPDDQAQVVVADGNFHGRTTTIVGFSSEPSLQAPLRPVHARLSFGPLRRHRRAGSGPHSGHRRRAAGTDPGRGRDRAAAGRLSGRGASTLPGAQRPADLGRNTDGLLPHRKAVRLAARGRPARHDVSGQGARRRAWSPSPPWWATGRCWKSSSPATTAARSAAARSARRSRWRP